MKTRNIAEFGDFQTPFSLAAKVCQRLNDLSPRSIVEPTCGRGSFVRAAVEAFPEAERVLGFDINAEHLRAAAEITADAADRVTLTQADFFVHDWKAVLRPDLGPWLIIGNPPWVTSAELGALGSSNLPVKSNFQKRKGFDAITGKANFDISEWMLLQGLDWLEGRSGALAVLCKTAVARKVLSQAWSAKRPISSAAMFHINALREFGAAVDACLFVMEIGQAANRPVCRVYESLDAHEPARLIGFDGRHLISDVSAYERTKALAGDDPKYVWRSGVKHDCSKVMELRWAGESLVNGWDDVVEVEEGMRFPLLKSSDVGNARIVPRGEMIVPQRAVGEDTDYLRADFPATWRYLAEHSALLDSRGSTIYQKGPRFSIFGVGAYTFAPWKVAISGFYKRLDFLVVGPVRDRPVVFDDTVYFLSCSSEEEARFIHGLLSSEPAQRFYGASIHWDEKRPITVGLLKRLSLRRLAEEMGVVAQYERFDGTIAFSRAA